MPADLSLQVSLAQLKLLEAGVAVLLKNRKNFRADLDSPANPAAGHLSPAQIQCLQLLKTDLADKRTLYSEKKPVGDWRKQHDKDTVQLFQLITSKNTNDVILLANKMMYRLSQNGQKQTATEIHKTLTDHLPGYSEACRKGMLRNA